MKTVIINDREIKHSWKLVDAENQTLGRLASRIAIILRGKDKPAYSPHQDWGDNVVVINAEKIKITGNKAETKTYFSHSGYTSGAKYRAFSEVMEKAPQDILKKAVKGMIKTTTPLGRKVLKKLFVYAGAEHPHEAQKPETIKF